MNTAVETTCYDVVNRAGLRTLFVLSSEKAEQAGRSTYIAEEPYYDIVISISRTEGKAAIVANRPLWGHDELSKLFRTIELHAEATLARETFDMAVKVIAWRFREIICSPAFIAHRQTIQSCPLHYDHLGKKLMDWDRHEPWWKTHKSPST